MTKFVSFLKEEAGASAAEYALILAIVGAGHRHCGYRSGRQHPNGDQQRQQLHHRAGHRFGS